MQVADTIRTNVQATHPELLQWFSINNTVSWVALSLGFLIFIMAYYAGGRENRNRLILASFLSLLITTLSFPLFLKLGRWLGILHSREGAIFILLLLLLFLSMLSCHIYEIVTVSARESHPPE
jgi:hypothetical protein